MSNGLLFLNPLYYVNFCYCFCISILHYFPISIFVFKIDAPCTCIQLLLACTMANISFDDIEPLSDSECQSTHLSPVMEHLTIVTPTISQQSSPSILMGLSDSFASAALAFHHDDDCCPSPPLSSLVHGSSSPPQPHAGALHPILHMDPDSVTITMEVETDDDEDCVASTLQPELPAGAASADDPPPDAAAASDGSSPPGVGLPPADAPTAAAPSPPGVGIPPPGVGLPPADIAAAAAAHASAVDAAAAAAATGSGGPRVRFPSYFSVPPPSAPQPGSSNYVSPGFGPQPGTSRDSDQPQQQQRSFMDTFLSIEEANLISQHFEYVSSFPTVAQMILNVYYPLYTSPIIPMCKKCVALFCINYSVLRITDYVFTDQVSTSFRDEFYCSMCSKCLFKLHNV